MIAPKKKRSKSRTRMKRASAWRLELPAMSTCPRCGVTKTPHRVCGTCGWYKGRIAIEVD